MHHLHTTSRKWHVYIQSRNFFKTNVFVRCMALILAFRDGRVYKMRLDSRCKRHVKYRVNSQLLFYKVPMSFTPDIEGAIMTCSD
jgi:hypothetical protein